MLMYEIHDGYFKGAVTFSQAKNNLSKLYTNIAPPELMDGEYAIWLGRWIKTRVPPMPPEPEYDSSAERIVWVGSEWKIVKLE